MDEIQDAMCSTCNVSGLTQIEFKHHCKSEFHTFNLKRKVAGLIPITTEVWEVKHAAAAAAAAEELAKGGNKKAKKKNQAPRIPRKVEPEPAKEDMWTECQSLFDSKVSASLEENVEYMSTKYSFFVPDKEYCSDLKGLILYLAEKIQRDRACIYCNKIYRSRAAVQAHMIDVGHTRIGTHTEELECELEGFYDFSASKEELINKLMGKRGVGALPALEGAVGERVKKKRKMTEEEEEDAEDDDDEEEDEDEEGGKLVECEDDDASGDDVVEVIECSAEDEFQAILEEYGLQRAEVLPNGSLQLPTGRVACSRSVAYIYKQKFSQTNRAADSFARAQLAEDRARSKHLMLADGGRQGIHGWGERGKQPGQIMMAVGTRQQKTRNRQVVAVFRQKQRDWLKLAIKGNRGDRMERFQSVKVSLYTWSK